MSTWLDRPSLALVYPAALPAAPGESRKGEDFLLERVIDGDRQCAIPIHLGHLTEKIRSMVRSSLQNVVLPLMNHFVCQRIDDLLRSVLAFSGDLLEQGEREANLAFGWRSATILIQARPRAPTADEHAD